MSVRSVFSVVVALVCAAALGWCASALAATVEAPGPVSVHGTGADSVALDGTLNPGQPGEAGTYEFLYRESASECEGASTGGPGIALGSLGEEVNDELSGLQPGAEYTVCLLARNLSGETAVGPPVTFQTVQPPTIEPASEVTSGTATVHGVLDPSAAGEPTKYQFIYQPSSHECQGPEQQTTEAGSAAGAQSEAVSAQLTRLLPGTEYAVCVSVTDSVGETAVSAPTVFATAVAALNVTEESVVSASSAEAELAASISSGGLATTYAVEYGTSEGYGSSTPAENAGAAGGPVSVRVTLSGLASGTTYHFRFVASNEAGSVAGQDETFATPAAVGSSSASVLPDERAYELVSSPQSPGEVYVPLEAPEALQDSPSTAPFRASADGNAVVYGADPAASGGSGSVGRGGGDQFLARRGVDGWSSTDIAAPGSQTLAEEGYQWFSSDLSFGVLVDSDRAPRHALAPGAPENCRVLYEHDNAAGLGVGSYQALFTEPQVPNKCGAALFAGASADGSRVFFQDANPLIAGTEEANGGGDEFCARECNLYESVGGQIRVVNVLPDGKPDPDAIFGGPGEETEFASAIEYPDFSSAISPDGSHVLWTDLKTGTLYLSENATRTVPVSVAAGRFWLASADWRYVYYTENGGLWRFDVSRFDSSSAPEPQALDEARERVTADGAGVQGVIGINETGEDSAYLYFVAEGALASGSRSLNCHEAGREEEEKRNRGTLSIEEAIRLESERKEEEDDELPADRGCNLYLQHDGVVTLIATLAPGDNNYASGLERNGYRRMGDWRANLGGRTAEVSPDGRNLVFLSSLSRSLTGYENRAVRANGQLGFKREAFVFDADSGSLSCASCAPDGTLPSLSELDTYLPVSANNGFMRRWMSEDGSRVFFDSGQTLVPQDTNGKQDVYEWEREGAPGCPSQSPARLNRGCVSLLSGGGGTDLSWFIDASADGRDVFLTSRSQLTPDDGSEKIELFDARAGGGFPAIEHACTGAGCQGVPPASPIFATPASATFSGIGNFAPAAKTAVKPQRKAAKKKAAKKCGKGRVRRRGKCVRSSKRRSKSVAKRVRGGGR